MTGTAASTSRLTPAWPRRLALLAALTLVWFFVFEAGLRMYGGSEAAPAFQQLFMPDPATGHRLRPGASADRVWLTWNVSALERTPPSR